MSCLFDHSSFYEFLSPLVFPTPQNLALVGGGDIQKFTGRIPGGAKLRLSCWLFYLEFSDSSALQGEGYRRPDGLSFWSWRISRLRVCENSDCY